MQTQNVTLSLPKELLRKAKLLAVERNSSLSGLLAQALADLVADDERYAAARARGLARLNDAPDLGTGGQAGWSRGELHER